MKEMEAEEIPPGRWRGCRKLIATCACHYHQWSTTRLKNKGTTQHGSVGIYAVTTISRQNLILLTFFISIRRPFNWHAYLSALFGNLTLRIRSTHCVRMSAYVDVVNNYYCIDMVRPVCPFHTSGKRSWQFQFRGITFCRAILTQSAIIWPKGQMSRSHELTRRKYEIRRDITS